MAIQIGKYKRPGIFIEEIDRSIFSAAAAAESITNLVIGVSKKGPVNTPIRLTTVTDLEAVFGQLDRNLERKGSFFHRTISKMLETTPVFAMNLLVTDDTLDKIEYKSLSSSAVYKNDIKREGPYRRFFDTTGFWSRDTEAFINLTKGDVGYADRALALTNLSDRHISVFVVKTSVSGFDRTLLEWYGSVEKMPLYVSQLDYASDYMVDVVVVGGDWSNYRELAVDSRWAQYFNASGLIKGQLRNFANDRNITLLAYYEGLSLIPYFRDLNGRNIFIETSINRDTDKTGLFCQFNADLVEKDYYTGLVDLTGNTLADMNATEIEFLSYKETISESVELTQVPLDLPGNVSALFGNQFGLTGSLLFTTTGTPSAGTYSINGSVGVSGSVYFAGGTNSAVVVNSGIGYQIGETFSATLGGVTASITFNSDNLTSVSNYSYIGQPGHAFDFNYVNPSDVKTSGTIQNGDVRTGYFGEGTVFNVRRSDIQNTTATFSNTYNAGTNAFVVVNGTKVDVINSKTFNISAASYPITGTSSYTSVFYLDSTGVIRSTNSLVKNAKPSVAADAVVLGYVELTINQGAFVSYEFTDITVDDSVVGYKDFVFGQEIVDTTKPDNRTAPDFYVEPVTTAEGFESSIKVTFIGTNTPASTSNYAQYRKYKMFNWLVDTIDSVNKDRVSLLLDKDTNTKYSLADATITDIEFSAIRNKSFVLNLMTTSISDILNGWLTFYTEDNEFILGSNEVVTKNEVATDLEGVAGKYSKFYLDFYNGIINTGDFFYDNRLYQNALDGTANSLADTAGTTTVTFIGGETATNDVYSEYAGYNYIILDTPEVNLTSTEQILVYSSELNSGVFTINNNTVNPTDDASDLASALGFTGSYAYEVAENVAYETLTDVNTIFAINSKNYLKMYIDVNGDLQAAFTDETLSASSTVDTIVSNTFYVQSELSNLKQTIEIETPTGYVQVPNKVLVNGARYNELKVGDFLEADTDGVEMAPGQTIPRKLTRVLSKRQYAGDTSLTEISCDAKILKTELVQGTGDFQTTRYVTIDQYSTTYKTISLKGFRIREASLPDGTEARQNTILNSVAKGTPLFKALTNKEAFDFRYLVDAFGLGLTERSKQQLVDICGERLDAFGFINMPSIRSFKNSSSPSFVNSEGVLQAEFIAKGGDPESNPAFLYSFGEGTGVSAVGYFTPYVVVNDNGRPLNFPPASYVATTYVRKHISNVSSVTPWTIAAGVTNGRVTNIAGLEIDWDPSDIDFLNPAQINPIVLKKNRGFVIETENTALVLYKSALSYIHTREVLIELERELSRMLLDYQWKFNTPDVRAEIKLRADVICETYVSRNGLFNYFNKMDDENNTSEIIDNQIGVLDTYVEPIKGMGIIVNNITILRTGAIAAGGFLNA
jgi:hypothetical protein